MFKLLCATISSSKMYVPEVDLTPRKTKECCCCRIPLVALGCSTWIMQSLINMLRSLPRRDGSSWQGCTAPFKRLVKMARLTGHGGRPRQSSMTVRRFHRLCYQRKVDMTGLRRACLYTQEVYDRRKFVTSRPRLR